MKAKAWLALVVMSLLSITSHASEVTTSEALLVKDVFISSGLLENDFFGKSVRLDDVACAYSFVELLPNGIKVDDSPVCAGFDGVKEVVIRGFDASILGGLVEKYGSRKNVAGDSVAVAYTVELRIDSLTKQAEATIQ